MRISQLAQRSGVPATTLRFYEDAGLLPADRTAAGYREYGEDAVERLAFISAAKHLGLPLGEISELLTVWQHGSCAEVKADVRPRIGVRMAEANQRIVESTCFVGWLATVLRHLDALPDRAGPCDAECGHLAPAQPASPSCDAPSAPDTPPGAWRTAPVACSLTGGGVTERFSAWHAVLDGADRAEIDDGLRLTLPADRAVRIAELAGAEQQCCPFFDFRLHLAGQVVHLEVRAPAEGANLLTELFGSAT